jgi:sugar lactone lactonase YvrE
MSRLKTCAVLALAAGLPALTGCMDRAATAQPAAVTTVIGGDDRNGEYVPAIGWMKDDPATHQNGITWGSHSDVSAIDPNRVFVVTWGDMDPQGKVVNANLIPGGGPTHMIVVLDRDGNVIENWSQWDTVMHTPHAIKVDPYDPAMPVYVVERGVSGGTEMEVLKFSNDGKQLLWRLGKEETPPATIEEARGRKPGPYQFGQPAVIAFFPNGDFIIGDGYWNCRVARYNRDGQYISEFGECGSGDGQFDTVHGLAVGRDGRIYVADRSNDRIQVFEEDGTWVATWPNIASPACVWADESDAIWVCGRVTNRMLKYDTEGHLLDYWGTYGRTSAGFDCIDGRASACDFSQKVGSGGFERPHGMSVDREGNFYVANFDGDVIGKFTPRPGGDRSRVILPQVLLTQGATN